MLRWHDLVWVSVGIAVSYAGFRLVKKSRISPRGILCGAFVALNLIMLVYIVSVPTRPVSDYKAIWDTAQAMAAGEFNVSDMAWTDYMYIYNWQLGISVFESWFIRLFGPQYLALQLFNVVVINATVALLYFWAKEICNGDRRPASIAALALALFWPFVVTVNQFTNQHLAALVILGVIIVLRRNKAICWAFAGILLVVLNIVRPMAVILLIAIFLYVFWCIFKGDGLKMLWRVCCLLAVFVAGTSFTDRAFIHAGYADSPISSPKLEWFKFDKGLTGYDCPDLEGFGSLEQFNRWERDKLIDEMTHRPCDVASYVSRKMIRYLGEWDYKYENTYNHDSGLWYRSGVWQLVMFGWGQYILLMFAAAAGYARYRRSHVFQLWEIVLLGLIAVYFVIEAFSSYRYESYPLLVLCAASLFRAKHQAPPAE